MKHCFVYLIAAVVLTASPANTYGQDPEAGYIGIFADQVGSDCNIVDPAPGLLNTYIVHMNTTGASAAQFKLATSGDAGLPSFISFTAQHPNLYNPNPDLFTDAALSYTQCVAGPWLLGTVAWFGNGTSPACSWFEIQPADGQTEVLAADCAPSPQIIISLGGRAYFNNDGTCDCSPPTPAQVFQTSPVDLEMRVDGSPVQSPYGALFAAGDTVEISVDSLQVGPDSATYAFSAWSDGGALTHDVIIAFGDTTFTAHFRAIAEVSFDTNPSGLPLVIDADTVTTPATFVWAAGDTHTISAQPAISAGADSVYNFSDWSDGGTATHDIVVPLMDTTFVASYDLFLEAPRISGIDDLVNDEDHRVTVSWSSSGYDLTGSTPLVIDYLVFREALAENKETNATFEPAVYKGMPAVTAPAGWQFVGGIPANGSDTYGVIVEAHADSTGLPIPLTFTKFLVRARTDVGGTYFDSPVDSGYSVDDVPPPPPINVRASYNTPSGTVLQWGIPEVEDFFVIWVYRDSVPNFTPGPQNLVFVSGTDTTWTDAVAQPWKYEYKLDTVDDAVNHSVAVSPGVVSAADTPRLPDRLTLAQNVPNPFNPSTTIRFWLPRESHVRLAVFDLKGRLVRALVSQSKLQGEHSVEWDGRDDRGHRVGSGVYFCQIRTDEGKATRKMVLLK